MERRKNMVLNSSAKKANPTAAERDKGQPSLNGTWTDEGKSWRRESDRARVDAGGPTPNHTRSHANGSANNVAEADITRERASLLTERQRQLDQVLDKHDDLVREKFHLENFVTLLGYDPSSAKQDDSVVFREYKAKFDLVEQVATEVGPSRSTRSAHSQRVMNITSQTQSSAGLDKYPSSPSVSFSVSAPPTRPSLKAKGKQKMVDMPESISNAKLAPPVSKRGAQGETMTVTTPSRPVKGRAPSPIIPRPPPKTRSQRILPTPKQPTKRTSFSMSSPTLSPVPLKKRKSTADKEVVSSRTRAGEDDDASTSTPPLIPPVSASDLAVDGVTKAAPLQKTTPSVKRIRLIVRRPPPSYTNPRQRPPPPRFKSSLELFLRSYTTLNDQDQTETTLQMMSMQEAVLRNKIDRLQRLGRFFPYTEFPPSASFGSAGGSSSISGSSGNTLSKCSLLPQEPQRPKDAWDCVVDAVVQRGRHGLVKGRQVAAHIASRIQVYWDHHASREKAAKIQEEKRLRTLAKATIKMVTSEWKKAVFYIREQERLRAEAEEKRRGHEHLDAILDQSGQILETQQFALAKGDMSRSRSRSSSVSMEDGWQSSSEEESVEDAESAEEFREIDMVEDIVEGGDVHDADESDLEDGEGESTRALLGFGTGNGEDFEAADTPIQEEDSLDHESMKTADGADIIPPDETEQMESVHDGRLPLLESVHGNSTSPASNAMTLDTSLDEHFAISFPSEDTSRQASPGPSLSSAVDKNTTPGQPWLMPDDDTDKERTILSPPNGLLTGATAKEDSLEAVEYQPSSMDDMASGRSEQTPRVPNYLKPFAVAPVDWSPDSKIKPPLLLRGVLRPYQQSGLEWLASLHSNNLNGILADEMGLGKTIQTIALLAHLACDRGIWGPHLIIVPTSVLLNWEMEFKKFLPGFRTLSYHGTTKRRKELRQGWSNKHHFNVCITSYALASRDAHIFKRKMWYYMVLDEAHMIKNFKSQRWNILLMFRSFRRLLLTGTPLQNNLTELWALLQFLMSGTDFANLKEFGEWFSNPLERAIEMGAVLDDENLQRVSKLHTVLRPYLLRRLKRDVEKELPSKYEHLVLCPLSKRQRFLYDEFMTRAQTREALQSGVYQKIANILMQLRKVCNHPDLFEVRPVITSFAMPRSAVADYEIKELLVRRRLLHEHDEGKVNLDLFGLRFISQQDTPLIAALETRRLNATGPLLLATEHIGEPSPKDSRTIQGYLAYRAHYLRAQSAARRAQIGYVNALRCSRTPIYSHEMLNIVRRCRRSILPLSYLDLKTSYLDTVTTSNAMVMSYEQRAQDLAGVVAKFAFVPPPVVAMDMPRFALASCQDALASCSLEFDRVLHLASVKLQIAFPDPSLLQYDCGKLQELSRLLRQKKAGGHRVLIFTQMTRILDILEIFLNFHGYLYLRLDGATKIEDRQYITERFNADARVFCFISSSRSGGVGINLTGADTVIFYDSDFNPQMDRQCEDRAHRIGQIRDVHIYRFISSHTVEEAMLMKANQKRSLDEIVIQKGEFDWRTMFEDDAELTKALGEFEDTEDAHAAAVAAREEDVLEGADKADFGAEGDVDVPETRQSKEPEFVEQTDDVNDDHGGGGTVSDYMVGFVRSDYEFFRDWRL
ncbi:SNF2 family N-terminal domain-containing protein [Pisolithus orientalis]|uniref:SNF2 family N-terminal domain-containing protein n=1 Tax=Pisolithus orientalis TaxID=936130 RepID=UPI002225645E|nr:SNF2 family N-terminal domain-containing protein [Pisolithus orientalis]KAI6007687.1 SNF2 family N-terminal domain-containing protein [Pisolithus orientalis]